MRGFLNSKLRHAGLVPASNGASCMYHMQCMMRRMTHKGTLTRTDWTPAFAGVAVGGV